MSSSVLKEIKLSIIIPVFNGEKFIKKCLDKVLKISLNTEIIVINDGSTDNSYFILNEYRDRIKLINLTENHGPSYARNLGIKNASGEYLTFIDSDDDFEIDMHEKMLNKMILDNSDICLCNSDLIETNGNKLLSKSIFDFDSISKSEALKRYLTDKIVPAIWAAIYKTQIVKDTLFNENLRIGEDILFLLKYLLRIEKVSLVSEILYHYIQHDSSAIHSVSVGVLEYLEVPNNLSKEEIDLLQLSYKNEFEYFKLEMIQRSVHVISLSRRLNRKSKLDLLKRCCAKSTCKKIAVNTFSSKYLKIEFFIMWIFGYRIHLHLFPLYNYLRGRIRKNDD